MALSAYVRKVFPELRFLRDRSKESYNDTDRRGGVGLSLSLSSTGFDDGDNYTHHEPSPDPLNGLPVLCHLGGVHLKLGAVLEW